ncbi:PH domain-containing protein [Thermoactinospora rubra]|uniref:PH domain-containing protein n=1 Tax=Thermoactinospora rubra TaxID=1088767 RepID=UPI000A10402C|nr:PH domain-containing protein [Thermoactinospora rubra]
MTSWQTLSRRSLGVTAVKSAGIAAPAGVVVARVASGLDWPVEGVVAACAAAAVLVVAGALVLDVLWLRATRWRLTGERLELRSGILHRKHRSVPRERIRSVDLKADPVLRLFGLAAVKVGTGEHASGEHDELTLDPLARQDAEKLRRTLLSLAGGQPPEGSLAELDWAWLRYAPLTVWTVAGGALVAGAAYKPLDALGLNPVKNGLADALWEWITERPWQAVPLLLGLNVLVGLVGAVAVFAEYWGRYRLEREPGRLRLTRGLLTTRSLTLAERRLRGVELVEGLLLRLGGGARVKAVATGLRKKDDEDVDDVSALTPPMPRELAVEVAERICGAPLPALRPRPAAARARRLRRAPAEIAVVAAVAAALDLLWLPSWIWLVAALDVPFSLGYALAEYRALAHGLGERHLVTRYGVAARRTVALDRDGVIGWTVTQSPFQRRLGLITVTATTAAGAGHYDVVDVGAEEGLELAARAVPGLLGPFLTTR